MKHITLVEIETPAWEITSPMGPDRTWRFAESSAYLPAEFDAIPSILSVGFQPAIVSLGKNLGQRARVSVTLKDHKHIMGAEPFEAGTFWGKWRGRYGAKLRGRAFRLIRGLEGQSLEQMETFHFVVESVDGPTPDGRYTIIATDVLKLADGDRALAPRPSSGFLLTAIDPSDTTATLSPAGVGDFEYPASGYVNLGGKEVCAFTRSGDTLTLTRAAAIPGFSFETEVVDHDAGSRVQLCLPYVSQDPADIIDDLFETYADVPGEYVPLSSWKDETGSFLQALYTTLITEPTPVNKLVSELIEQAALSVWWDAKARTVRLRVLRPIATTAQRFTEDHILAGSLSTREQPESRLSDVLTYFALRNPLRPVGETDNYRSSSLRIDPEAISEYNGRANKIIFSRWIPFGARTVAERLNLNHLGRFRDPPRRINFATFRHGHGDVDLGGGYQLGWTSNQDAQGVTVLAPIQVTRLNPMPDRFEVEAEEMLFWRYEGTDLADRVLIIDTPAFNVNLRELHDSIYPEIEGDESPAISVTLIIEESVVVGSNPDNTFESAPALNIGSWPPGIVPRIIIRGRVQGAGGNGNIFNADPNQPLGVFHFPGSAGRPALRTRHPIELDVSEGELWGGGGGGGGGQYHAGGGGAGTSPGEGGVGHWPSQVHGSPGTAETGGSASGGRAGSGGNPGQPGQNGKDSVGGAAGAAVDGISFVTFTGSPAGDVRGPLIN